MSEFLLFSVQIYRIFLKYKNIIPFLFSVSRLVVEDFFAEVGGVEVGVYLGGYQVFVAEHHLYYAQVGSAFEQMCGKGVAEGVGTDGLFYPGFCC